MNIGVLIRELIREKKICFIIGQTGFSFGAREISKSHLIL